MEIVHRGEPEGDKEHDWTCKRCKSVIRARKREGRAVFERNESSISFSCPVCEAENRVAMSLFKSRLVIRFEQTEGPLGDQTYNYNVIVPAGTTVGKFIEAVLTRGEWGEILIEGDYPDRICYRHGHIDPPMKFSESDKAAVISSITANGGWSLMDYSIRLLPESKDQD